MKIISKMLKFVAVFLLVVGIQSCSNDDDNNVVDPGPQNIVQLAVATPSLSNLVAALQAADGDLVAVLSGPGPFTVLAPTNDAFAAFLSDNGFNSLNDVPTDVLSQILLNHVIAGDVLSTDLVAAGSGYASTSATGAGGRNLSIYYNTSNGVRFNNAGSVTSADIDASNGTIHIVDGVIGLPSIVDHAAANPSFSTLVGALSSANLVDAVNGFTEGTVLAPVNSAFEELDAIPTGEALSQVLLNHVVATNVFSDNLIDAVTGYANTLATGPGGNNLSLYYNTSDGVVFNGASEVAVADVVATNGVIHAVDAVILPPTIATFATTNSALNSLVAALQLADTGTPTVPWIETVSDASAGPFTVFAPTNGAFADLLLELDPSGNTALGDLAPATVDAVLLMHVVGANVQSSGLPNGSVTTLGGNIMANNTAFTLTDPNGRVSDIVTTLVDIQGVNGVVHVIDKVILPQQ
ncbi:fasciclin domain-containing protein [Paucihalobacter sp.]|uniref:fasciclin domain-containing protein n=1 Tax=Paucihalobacter sp. TaxID=2850405 RepID=UPI002FDFC4C3